MYKELSSIIFPSPTNLNINMMPFIMGDVNTLPANVIQYAPLINQCELEKGTTVYLTIQESIIEQGKTQRRPGIHTDATSHVGWGGGSWGGTKGIYMASSDGLCELWDVKVYHVDRMGQLIPFISDKVKKQPNIKMKSNTLYWMTDRTPHQSLPAEQTGMRQFFRLVAEDVGLWWAKHSTPSPFGIEPKCPITHKDKFAT